MFKLLVSDGALLLALRFCRDPSPNGTGCARMLLDLMACIVRAERAHRISLQTAKTKLNAQRFYPIKGYEAEGEFLTYHL
jgi:hypothetical protein